MTIYVDGITTHETTLRYKQWSHMISDTSEEELHAFAARLGLKRSWFQCKPKASAAHYDITPSKRRLAVALGAVEITSRQLLDHNYDKTCLQLSRMGKLCGTCRDSVDKCGHDPLPATALPRAP